MTDNREQRAVDQHNQFDPLSSNQVYDPETTYKILTYLMAEALSTDKPAKPKLLHPLTDIGALRIPVWIPLEMTVVAMTDALEHTLIGPGEYGVLIQYYQNSGGALNMTLKNGDGDVLDIRACANGAYTGVGNMSYGQAAIPYAGTITGTWSGAGGAGAFVTVMKAKLAVVTSSNDGA